MSLSLTEMAFVLADDSVKEVLPDLLKDQVKYKLAFRIYNSWNNCYQRKLSIARKQLFLNKPVIKKWLIQLIITDIFDKKIYLHVFADILHRYFHNNRQHEIINRDLYEKFVKILVSVFEKNFDGTFHSVFATLDVLTCNWEIEDNKFVEQALNILPHEILQDFYLKHI